MAVYYIRSGEHRIKIGKADDPRKRLRELRTGNPERLELLATEPGDLDLERARHRQFRRDRTQGEWFRASPALLRHIADVRAGNPSTTMGFPVWLKILAVTFPVWLKVPGVMFLLSWCVSRSDKAHTPTAAAVVPPAVENVAAAPAMPSPATMTPTSPKVKPATQTPPKARKTTAPDWVKPGWEPGSAKKKKRPQRLELPCRPGQPPPCYD